MPGTCFRYGSIESARANRDDLIASLAAEGIGTSVHYRPLHEMTYWKERYHCEQASFPVASRYFEGAVTLPLFAGMTDAEVDRVVAACARSWADAPCNPTAIAAYRRGHHTGRWR